jgi:plasmid stabilization system protein ParE
VRVIFAPRAERHIETLYDYIVERAGEVRAEAYIRGVLFEPDDVSTAGNQRDDLLPGLRTIVRAARYDCLRGDG